MVLILSLSLIYLVIGVLRVRRENGPGGAIAMIGHNFGGLGLLMLAICILFWPIENLAIMFLMLFIKD